MQLRAIVLAVTLALALAVGVLASSSGANNPPASFDLTVTPKPVVSEGALTLASARFANLGSNPLTLVKISFDIPTGSFEFASPGELCALSALQEATGGATTRVTCEIGKVPAGEVVEQFVAFATPAGVAEVAVDSQVTYKQGSRSDSDSTGVSAAGNPDEVGTCATEGGTIASEATTGEANPQSTSVTFTESVDLPCTPISVGEQERTQQNPGCPPGVTCTTQVSFATIPVLPEPATVILSFEREVLPPGTKPRKFVLWETPDKFPAQPIRRVLACPLPPGEDSCIVKVTKYRKKGIQVVLQVIGSGEDPRYAG